MTDREVMQQTLEALQYGKTHKAITILREALEQPEQQAEPPPEWPLIKNILAVFGLDAIAFVAEWKAAQRPWQGLTEEEVKHLYPYGRSVWGKETFEAIEKALKEKNNAN